MPVHSRELTLRRPLLLGVAILLLACDGAANPLAPDPEPEVPDPASLPVFTITSPAPGSMLETGTTEDETVTVTGQVCDPLYAIASLTVGGSPVTVSGTDKCVPFSVPHASRWGMTMVSGLATNTKGQSGHLAHSFIRSGAYLADNSPGGSAALIDSAIVTVLDATLLDDGEPGGTDDLAGLFELALGTVNVNSLIPAVITGGVPPAPDCPLDLPNLGYRVAKGGAFTMGSWTVSQVAVGDALHVTVRMNGASLPLTVNGYSNGCLTGLLTTTTTGTVGAATLSVVLPFVPTVVEDVPSWALVADQITTSSSGLTVNVDLGVLAFLGPMVNTIASAAANGVAGIVHDRLRGTIANFIKEELLLDADHFALNEDGNIILPFSAIGLGKTEATEAMKLIDGDLKLSKKVEIKPIEKRPGPGAPKGPVKYPKQPLPPKEPTNEILIAIHWDLLNQYFWSAWSSGAFDLTSFESAACGALPTGLQVTSHAKLPPVVMPTADGLAMELGIGGITVNGMVEQALLGRVGAPVPFSVTVGAIVGVDFVLDASTLKISGIPKPGAQVGLQVGSIGGAELVGPIRDAVGPYLACVAREITLAALSSFPIPTFKIGTIPGTGLPAEKVWVPEGGTGKSQLGWSIHQNKKA